MLVDKASGEENEDRTEPLNDSDKEMMKDRGAYPIFPFAMYLFDEGLWEQAATEFQRFCFFHPEDEQVPEAMLLIGICYEALNKFGEAIAEYRNLAANFPESAAAQEALYKIGETYYRAGKFEEARIALQGFIDRKPSAPRRQRAQYRMAWASLRLHAFSVAENQFSELALQDSPCGRTAEEISLALKKIRDLPYCSPVLAGTLSALLPGAGQLYAGAYKDALLSFLVNGALIVGAYEAFDKEVYGVGGIVSVVALTFYAGNLYGAVNSAHHANHEKLTVRLNELEKKYEWYAGCETNESRNSSRPVTISLFHTENR